MLEIQILSIRVKEIRKNLGLTQATFAPLVGICEEELSLIERGKAKDVKLSTLQNWSLAKLLLPLNTSSAIRKCRSSLVTNSTFCIGGVNRLRVFLPNNRNVYIKELSVRYRTLSLVGNYNCNRSAKSNKTQNQLQHSSAHHIYISTSSMSTVVAAHFGPLHKRNSPAISADSRGIS